MYPKGKVSILPFFLSVFAFSHGVTGIAIFMGAVKSLVRCRGLDSRIAEHPDSPMEWRDDWKKGESRFPGSFYLLPLAYSVVAVLVAVWWSTTNTWLVESSAVIRIIGISASLLGLIPIVLFLKSIRNFWISRSIKVELPDGALISGRSNRIRLRRSLSSLPMSLTTTNNWKLICVDGRVDSEDSESELEKYSFDAVKDSVGASEMILRVDIPDYAPATSAPNDLYTGITWKLEGAGVGPFEIPVLENPDFVPPDIEPESEIELPESIEEINALLSTENITYLESGGDHLFQVPPNRHPSNGWFAILFGLIFAAIGSGVGFAMLEMVIPALVGLLFLGVGGYVSWTGIRIKWEKSVLGKFGEDQTIRVEKTLGPVKSLKNYPLAEVKGIRSEQSFQQGNVWFYKVVLTEDSGKGPKNRVLVDWIKNKAAADVIAGILRK